MARHGESVASKHATTARPGVIKVNASKRLHPGAAQPFLSGSAPYARACHVLPPARAAAPPRIAGLVVPIALEKGAEAIVAPDIVARLARHKAALGLVVQHRDELGAIVGLAAQRLVREDDRGSRQCSRRDAI